MNEKDYTKKDIVKIFGPRLTPRAFQFYVDEGIIRPDINSGEGRGNVRRFSGRQVFRTGFLVSLLDYSPRLEVVRALLESLDAAEEKWWDSEKGIPKQGNLFFRALRTESGGFVTSIMIGGGTDGDRVGLRLTSRDLSALVVALKPITKKMQK